MSLTFTETKTGISLDCFLSRGNPVWWSFQDSLTSVAAALVYFIKPQSRNVSADSFYLLFPLIALRVVKWWTDRYISIPHPHSSCHHYSCPISSVPTTFTATRVLPWMTCHLAGTLGNISNQMRHLLSGGSLSTSDLLRSGHGWVPDRHRPITSNGREDEASKLIGPKLH